MRKGLVIVFILSLIACQNKYQKLLKGTDYDKQYEVAMLHYNEQEYLKAQQLFEQVISVFRGSKKGENALYYLARCHYEMGDFMLAGYYFKNYVLTYPNGEKLEENQFYAALSYYNESPKTSLDQEYTSKAINEFQQYINQFPKSERVDTCNQLMSQMRNKLEKKAYDIAYLYVKLEKYKAATTELSNYLKEFPDSDFREDVLFLLVKSSYELAKNSVKSKQLERYEDAIESYYSYIDEYPKGKEVKEAEKMYSACKKYIDKF